MTAVRNSDKIPDHLPKRLTIAFPNFGLYDTTSGGVYHDVDRIMREHKERGFNCIRMDDGAGLIHDLDGDLRGPVPIGYIFGGYDKALRQWGVNGEPGLCDPHARLIEYFEAAKRHDMYIILSAWYYLHTCWLAKDRALNRELHELPPLERFNAFAKFLHYIIADLEERGLADRIAFAEIFNEADGLYFVNGYTAKAISDEKVALFREKHEEAIEWLKEQHPDILFAFDSYTTYTDLRQAPKNMQVYDFHNYFLWIPLYRNLLEKDLSLVKEKVTMGELRALADSDYLPAADWYHLSWFYINLDPDKIPEAEKMMTDALKMRMEEFRERFRASLDALKNNLDNNLPPVPVVCGEGVTYSGGYNLVWEEKSEEYWTLIKEVMEAYREMGLWGTVIRTCSGPEDPVWHMCPDKLLEMNKIFLGEE